ncbi:MCCC1 [Bugula neritina]|uniref:MCCC1 n=1 Tax=Bugula neritina TaxID=10212 RepID=A0A7J7KFR4_BUGNE|nr:MCCC1 [Bugula neritina]
MSASIKCLFSKTTRLQKLLKVKPLYRNAFSPLAYATQASFNEDVPKKPIKRLLIANRGEIAVRVMKTAKELGIQTVAVYSEADADSLHVSVADKSYCIGPADSQRSYLNKEKIIQVCKDSGSQAIHPGYGFLSENTEFAELCQQNDITFIGPPSSAIRDMGIKSTSKHIMSAANVPIIEGYHGDDQSDDRLAAEAKKIGFPVMIKAVRGGGGKGMRIAMTEDEFLSQLSSAKNEAMKSFGDQVMLVEKFVVNPRHVEVQVFGDQHGNYVYLFERDCSVQRRHQKIIEEAPAPHLTEEVRRQLGEAAVRAARAVNYVGAGTVEFVMDAEQKFYFMEMNTRLQVEHPVSEMITETDLVEWQLRVAAGEPLPLTQDDLEIYGHSFEARVYAEDPDNEFMPGAGHLQHVLPPDDESYVRVETGIRQGDEVSVHYDPMIAKLVVWGEDRPTALARLISALQKYQIVGLSTNINFMLSLAQHPEFQLGNVHTEFIPQHYDTLFPHREVSHDQLCLAVVTVMSHRLNCRTHADAAFTSLNSLRINHEKQEVMKFKHGDKVITCAVTSHPDGTLTVTSGEQSSKLKGSVIAADLEGQRTTAVAEMEEQIIKCDSLYADNTVHLFTENGLLKLEVPPPAYETSESSAAARADSVAPMPGVIDKIFVQPGDTVEEGQQLIVMIAMKMEYIIRAPRAGVVDTVPYTVGTTVPKGARLVHLQKETDN